MILDFKTVANIRDLGGIRTIDGYVIKDKLILRSSDLHLLSEEEYERLLSEFNLKMVVDFRSTKSFVGKKDRIDGRVKQIHTLVLKRLEKESYDRTIKEDPDDYFRHIYEQIATNEEAVETYRQFIRHLISCDDGAILYHCTSGKDRTGIATTLILYILGCDYKTILLEHLESNKVTYKLFLNDLAKHKNPSAYDRKFYETFHIAKKKYLDCYFDSIAKKYGSYDRFVHEILGVTEEDTELLRKRYLILN